MSFARLLSEATSGPGLPATGDVLAVGLPLLRQLDDLHRAGLVSRLGGVEGLTYDGTALRLDAGRTQPPTTDDRALRRLDPATTASGVDVVARLGIDHGTGSGTRVTSLDVHDGAGDPPDRPVLVVGYRAWEQLLGHHDVLTDVHLAGLYLVSYAAGLDLDVEESVHELALQRHHLTGLNPSLHPVVAGVLAEMVAPERHRRPNDLAAAIARLEHHRDLPTDLDLTEAYATGSGWHRGVLATLRERVFDVSRRNRALHFRPSASSLSLTEASVPLLLDVERIAPKDLLTWTGEGAAAFRSGRAVDLERWCRFEEAPHLAPGLDALISQERRLRAEHGQGRLRLIIAFLRWADPETGEVVTSPLITLPAELTRKKGVRDRYRVRVDDEGEVNPVLRHVFRSRFGIVLPEEVGTDAEAIAALVSQIQALVRTTDQSVRVDLIETPRVNIIRRRAQLRVDAYVRRRAQALAASGRWRRQDHSYDPDDWRPLGRALYRTFVEPRDLPLRDLSGAAPRPRRPEMLAPPAEVTARGERVQSQYQVSAGEVSRHRWEVDLCAVTLASLGSRRSSLSRDYDSLLASPEVDQPARWVDTPFDALFSPDPRATPSPPGEGLTLDQVLVLPADDAQARAVRRGLDGDSLIIQGPPGTGKSQTIANLIAASVAEGRRVLFVCEKRAALDVVAQRLRQVGLGPLVATIHDSQLDRKAFIGDLGQVYADWLTDRDDDPVAARAEALAAVEAVLAPLDRAFVELGDARGGRRSLAELIERLVQLRQRGVEAPAAGTVAALDAGRWLAARPRLDPVAATLTGEGRAGVLGDRAVLRVAPRRLVDGDPVVIVRRVGEDLVAAVAALAELAGGAVVVDEVPAASVAALAGQAPALAMLADHGALAVLDPGSGAHLDARAGARELDRLTAAAAATAAVTERWTEPLGAEDTRAALAVATAKEGSALRFLSGPWRKVSGLLRDRYRWDLHEVEPPASQVLTELLGVHEAHEAVAAHRAALSAAYGTDDLRPVLDQAEAGRADPLVQAVAAGSSAADVGRLGAAAAALTALVDDLVVDDGVPCGELRRTGEAMARASVGDERTLVAWAALADVDLDVVRTALSAGATLDEVERYVLDRALDQVGSSGALGGLTGAQLDRTVEELHDRYQDLLRANAGLVTARARATFRDHVAHSEASMAGRSDDDKERKRSYRAGRKLLEREVDKKMRFRAIRELAGGDSGQVVRDLKPVWLMSPLSVSDTLPLDDDLFDVVVFDEASQIPVEDAVPTLFRARQAIVVGDRMQLPPTRFFSTSAEDEDDVVVEDEGHRITLTLDADSFLTQADLSLDSTMLTWHYRSRSESLIAYSNHAFYGGRLATVPDRHLDAAARPPIEVTAADDAGGHLAATLDRPISFHAVPGGIYEARRNEAEADYIAELVRALLASGSGHTIGIVAFSEAQQGAIESALAELAVLDRGFAEQLEEEQARTDDGELVGLFVKNLENVQGDERDVIIMSVCYGRTAEGRMRMGFGPINQAGGERRLNVIFSRAKQHMVVVSSITGRDITNTHNDGAAHLARFLDYAAAESVGGAGGDALLRALDAPGGEPGDRAAEARRSAVAADVAARLRGRGHEVDVAVGRSHFAIDLAVRRADAYVLGLMIDPGPDGATPVARLVAEAAVLDAMGWPVTRILVTEWWTDPDAVLDRLELLLREG